MDPAALIAQSLGGAWTSGLNAYATCAALGLLGRYGGLELSGSLDLLESWWVIGPALAMYAAEFFADKVPWLDSAWDLAHTFVRIPVGALLAAGGFSESGLGAQVGALAVGGTLASQSHALKAGARAIANASPEPVTNWILSLAEDAAVIGGIVFALKHPVLFLCVLAVAIVLAAIALFYVGRGARLAFRALARMLHERRAMVGT